jgi:hypothetical protein
VRFRGESEREGPDMRTMMIIWGLVLGSGIVFFSIIGLAHG